MPNRIRPDPTAGRPITPKEAMEEQPHSIPPEVYDTVNEFIKLRSSDNPITITQNEVMAALLLRMPHVKRQQVWDSRWLDFEAAYKKAGWKVVYDKPGYDETYEAFWEFSRGR